MKIGVLGSGIVGETLAEGFIKHGYDVMRGSRSPEKLVEWGTKIGEKAKIGNFLETAEFGDVVVLAVKGNVVETLVQRIDKALKNKIVIDTTNPIEESAPVNGVLNFFTNTNDSLMERLQEHVKKAKFVKAFNSIGSAFMVNPEVFKERPSMFICGNDEAAKVVVSKILHQFGHDVEDMGAVEAARAIEPLCRLWCIPGLRGGSWRHAFRLIK